MIEIIVLFLEKHTFLYIFRLFLLPSDKTIYFFFKVARALVTDNSKLENVFVNLLRLKLATVVLSWLKVH